jgi:hypothetical protein
MILKNAWLYIFLIGCCSFLFLNSLFAQNGLEQNSHVIYEVTLDESIYTIQYRFKDHFGNYQNYELVLPYSYTQQAIKKFGIPTWLFEPYVDSEENRRARQYEMSKGLFMLDENLIEVDKSAVINYYSPHYFKPIAEMIISSLADYGRDTRRDRIEMTIRFVQDIPYGIPDPREKKRHFGGVIPPPKVLIEGYGDCDSKVMLFVGILMYLIPGDDIIFLNQEEHVLAAIKETPEKGLTYIEYKGEDYLVAETAGPGKRLLGQKGNYYRSKFRVENLRFKPPKPLPYQNDVIAQKPLIDAEQVKNNSLVIKNRSERGFKFQISADNKHWKNFYLGSNTYGNYTLEKEQQVYLRYRGKGSSFNIYKIYTGNSYTFDWNNRKKLWEIEF